MKLHLVIEVSDRMMKIVSENAIERVINSSINIAESSDHPDSYTNVEDWNETKRTVVDLWVRLQDAIFRHVNYLPPQE